MNTEGAPVYFRGKVPRPSKFRAENAEGLRNELLGRGERPSGRVLDPAIAELIRRFLQIIGRIFNFLVLLVRGGQQAVQAHHQDRRIRPHADKGAHHFRIGL